jgi:hypothetical protein
MPAVDPVVKDWFELGSYIATLLGIPIAILLLWNERRKDRIARQEQVYLSPNAQYIDYLKLCFDNPDLDIYDLVTPTKRTPENTKKEWIAFNILISIMEQAYLLYRNHPDPSNKQWQGWRDYIRWWLTRPNFGAAWSAGISDQFDADFVAFVNSLPPYDADAKQLSYKWMNASHSWMTDGAQNDSAIAASDDR